MHFPVKEDTTGSNPVHTAIKDYLIDSDSLYKIITFYLQYPCSSMTEYPPSKRLGAGSIPAGGSIE